MRERTHKNTRVTKTHDSLSAWEYVALILAERRDGVIHTFKLHRCFSFILHFRAWLFPSSSCVFCMIPRRTTQSLTNHRLRKPVTAAIIPSSPPANNAPIQGGGQRVEGGGNRRRPFSTTSSLHSSSSSFVTPATPRQQQGPWWVSRLVRTTRHSTNMIWVLVWSTLCAWYQMLVSLWHQWTGPVITLDNGLQVRIGSQLAEGGFSYVFQATLVQDDKSNNDANTRYAFSKSSHDEEDPPSNSSHRRSSSSSNNNNSNYQNYALKRIYIGADDELRQACMEEANVHHAAHHVNLMPLLGFLKTNEYCFMLFPLCSHSLRDEVNRRTGILESPPNSPNQQPFHGPPKSTASTDLTEAPWSESHALHLFLRICSAAHALHQANYTHRDIKLENILIQTDRTTTHPSDDTTFNEEPILMDFGSAGPLVVSLNSRQDVLSAVELAAQHTTLPYRPPELLEGSLSVGTVLDYRAVDVWSLGCTLFAMLYGASPMECAFSYNQGGRPKIVDCTTLRILNARVPEPPVDSPVAAWYSRELTHDLIPSLLHAQPDQRPTVPHLMTRVAHLIVAQGGHVPNHIILPAHGAGDNASTVPNQHGNKEDEDDDDDGFSDFYSSTPA